MGWLSDTWSSAKDVVSDVGGAIEDVGEGIWSGLESAGGEVLDVGESVWGELERVGDWGDSIWNEMERFGNELMGIDQGGGAPAMTGPLMQTPSEDMLMGSQGPRAAQTVAPQDLASLFGPSGYSYGPPSQLSAALLQPNPEAYQYKPLMSGLS